MARARIFISLGVAAAVTVLAALPAAAEMKFHYDCHVTQTQRIEHMGREGQHVELVHFTCNISGGLLDGFVATGTNLLEPDPGGARLVGSTVLAHKGNSTLAYEVNEAKRRERMQGGRVVGWESTGTGTYKRATGSAAPLAGKSFTALVRSTGPQTFTIDSVVRD